MKIVQIIICLGISWIVSTITNAAAGREAHYTVLDSVRVSEENDNVYWDYLGRSFDSLKTNQYGYQHPTKGVQKRLYKTPAIHGYHGAGSVLQPIYLILPPEAYENLPSTIKAIVPKDNIDIFFLVTLVQDWHETDGATRPLAVRPHHWNDPEAPYTAENYNKSFVDEIGIFDPSPPELKVNGIVNTLYSVTETTHGPGMVISSGDSDHLIGGYTYTTDTEPDLNLCFWGVVKGPTPSGTRTAVTLHWVTSDHSLKAIKSLRNGMSITTWARRAESSGIYAPCAERLRSLLGLPIESTSMSAGAAGGSGAGIGAFLPRALPAPVTPVAASVAAGGAGAAGVLTPLQTALQEALEREHTGLQQAKETLDILDIPSMGVGRALDIAGVIEGIVLSIQDQLPGTTLENILEAIRTAPAGGTDMGGMLPPPAAPAFGAWPAPMAHGGAGAGHDAAAARRDAEAARAAAEAAERAPVAPRMDVGGGAGEYHLTIAAGLKYPAYQGVVAAKLEAMGGTGDPVREHNLVQRVNDHLDKFTTTTPALMKKIMMRW